jgi:hypothetical protein
MFTVELNRTIMRKISLCFLTVLFSFPLVIMAEQSFFIKNEGQLIN